MSDQLQSESQREIDVEEYNQASDDQQVERNQNFELEEQDSLDNDQLLLRIEEIDEELRLLQLNNLATGLLDQDLKANIEKQIDALKQMNWQKEEIDERQLKLQEIGQSKEDTIQQLQPLFQNQIAPLQAAIYQSLQNNAYDHDWKLKLEALESILKSWNIKDDVLSQNQNEITKQSEQFIQNSDINQQWKNKVFKLQEPLQMYQKLLYQTQIEIQVIAIFGSKIADQSYFKFILDRIAAVHYNIQLIWQFNFFLLEQATLHRQEANQYNNTQNDMLLYQLKQDQNTLSHLFTNLDNLLNNFLQINLLPTIQQICDQFQHHFAKYDKQKNEFLQQINNALNNLAEIDLQKKDDTSEIDQLIKQNKANKEEINKISLEAQDNILQKIDQMISSLEDEGNIVYYLIMKQTFIHQFKQIEARINYHKDIQNYIDRQLTQQKMQSQLQQKLNLIRQEFESIQIQKQYKLIVQDTNTIQSIKEQEVQFNTTLSIIDKQSNEYSTLIKAKLEQCIALKQEFENVEDQSQIDQMLEQINQKQNQYQEDFAEDKEYVNQFLNNSNNILQMLLQQLISQIKLSKDDQEQIMQLDVLLEQLSKGGVNIDNAMLMQLEQQLSELQSQSQWLQQHLSQLERIKTTIQGAYTQLQTQIHQDYIQQLQAQFDQTVKDIQAKKLQVEEAIKSLNLKEQEDKIIQLIIQKDPYFHELKDQIDIINQVSEEFDLIKSSEIIYNTPDEMKEQKQKVDNLQETLRALKNRLQEQNHIIEQKQQNSRQNIPEYNIDTLEHFNYKLQQVQTKVDKLLNQIDHQVTVFFDEKQSISSNEERLKQFQQFCDFNDEQQLKDILFGLDSIKIINLKDENEVNTKLESVQNQIQEIQMRFQSILQEFKDKEQQLSYQTQVHYNSSLYKPVIEESIKQLNTKKQEFIENSQKKLEETEKLRDLIQLIKENLVKEKELQQLQSQLKNKQEIWNTHQNQCKLKDQEKQQIEKNIEFLKAQIDEKDKNCQSKEKEMEQKSIILKDYTSEEQQIHQELRDNLEPLLMIKQDDYDNSKLQLFKVQSELDILTQELESKMQQDKLLNQQILQIEIEIKGVESNIEHQIYLNEASKELQKKQQQEENAQVYNIQKQIDDLEFLLKQQSNIYNSRIESLQNQKQNLFEQKKKNQIFSPIKKSPIKQTPQLEFRFRNIQDEGLTQLKREVSHAKQELFQEQQRSKRLSIDLQKSRKYSSYILVFFLIIGLLVGTATSKVLKSF